MTQRKKKGKPTKRKLGKRPLRTVLIPNRGEIALRIVRSVQSLGLRAIVAYSDVDGDSLAVRQADDAVLLGPAVASESYLAIDRIIAAAKRVNADAIHPGYGFLSERQPFARAIEDAGLLFIGPTPTNIQTMGDKIAARATLQEAGVPVVPGKRQPVQTEDELMNLGEEVGFPLLLKAAGGGGGKGIRLVRDSDSLPAAFHLASSEAKNAFGDPTLYAERYLERARHVEVQILGDGRGGARVFLERDCSIQRRHQKLIEESPCPIFDAKTREKLLGYALRAVQTSKYRGAGTLEFLHDTDGGLYFLEMNTRLQVEHPITELVSGVDLVAEQIAVAEGKTYPGRTLEKCSVASNGAAIELRVNAEDPDQDFTPSIGHITEVRFPGGAGVRIDSGAFSGMEITPFYDSLIAKVIAHGSDRSQALKRLLVACEEIVISGVETTVPVGVAMLRDADFCRGEYHCQFLETRLEDPTFLFPRPEPELAIALAFAAAWISGQDSSSPRLRRTQSPEDARPDSLSPWARLGRTQGLRGIDS